MSIFTFNLYQIHWFYKQWSYVRDEDGRRFNPALRALWSLFFAYPLLRAIRKRGEARGINVRWSPALLTAIYLGFNIFSPVFSTVFGPFLLLGPLSILPLVVVQQSVNQLNVVSAEQTHYTTLNAIAITVGAILIFGAMLVAFKGVTGSPSAH
jgi:hypothetical protein